MRTLTLALLPVLCCACAASEPARDDGIGSRVMVRADVTGAGRLRALAYNHQVGSLAPEDDERVRRLPLAEARSEFDSQNAASSIAAASAAVVALKVPTCPRLVLLFRNDLGATPPFQFSELRVALNDVPVLSVRGELPHAAEQVVLDGPVPAGPFQLSVEVRYNSSALRHTPTAGYSWQLRDSTTFRCFEHQAVAVAVIPYAIANREKVEAPAIRFVTDVGAYEGPTSGTK
jgi:hypothetical protein